MCTRSLSLSWGHEYRRAGNFRVKNILCVNFMALNFRKADRSSFAAAIAREGMDCDSDPFGSGSPSLGTRYFSRAMAVLENTCEMCLP